MPRAYPYIGITDFMTADQARVMYEHFRFAQHKGSLRRLHVGVMMSYKTLHGLPTKWAAVFPKKESIAEIFCVNEALNCLHYADYENRPDVSRALEQAIYYGGVGMNGLQLDMIWPDPCDIMNAVNNSRRKLEVILQVGANAMGLAKDDPREVVERLRDYCGVIHHVLIDKSMGKGLGMDAEVLLPFVRQVRKSLPWLSVAVAGGLGPDTLHLAEPIFKEFPDISIDAEGRLRPSGNALDPVDWNMAGSYIVKALRGSGTTIL